MADPLCATCQAQAEGYCIYCQAIMCSSCFAQHQCAQVPTPEEPINSQCCVCYMSQAESICACQFPCPNLCTPCALKHADNPALHLLIPIVYRPSLQSIENYHNLKSRQISLQTLSNDMATCIYRIEEFQRNFETEITNLMAAITAFSQKTMHDLETSKSEVQERMEHLKLYFFQILLGTDATLCPEIFQLVGNEYKPMTTFTSQIDFSPAIKSLPESSWFKCQLLDAISSAKLQLDHSSKPNQRKSEESKVVFNSESAGLRKPKVCSNCGKAFIRSSVGAGKAAQKFQSVAGDFCSDACLTLFMQLVECGESGTVRKQCEYCLKEFIAEEEENSVVLPCSAHAYHSLDCFIHYLLKKSEFFRSKTQCICEKCAMPLNEKFIVKQFEDEEEYKSAVELYRSAKCMQCNKLADVLTDCSHILCKKCMKHTPDAEVCPVCETETFPNCEKCGLNGTKRLSCKHFLCSTCAPVDPASTVTCPICKQVASVQEQASVRDIK